MMKKAKFLTVFLTSAILLSGCKASENSDAVSVSTSTSETSEENSVVSSTVSSVESASSDVSTAISSSSTVISSVESTSTVPTEPTTSEPEPVVSEPASAPEWTETPTSGTMYVNMSCFSRSKAVLGAEKVKQYFLNDAVTVTARATSASTGDIYYKIAEGEFIHSDYLSSSKIVIQQPSDQTSNQQTPSSSNNNQPSSSGTPKDGDTKVENGKTYEYWEGFGWIEGEPGVGVIEPSAGTETSLGETIGY